MKADKTKRSFEIDMCNGPILSKIVIFALPLVASGILQLLFNAADVIVVGRFAGSQSLAAVGSTSSLINLLLNVFIGLSTGTNVLVARFYGSHNYRDLEETIHTSMLLSVICGFILIFIGEIFATPILELMGSPDDVLPLASLYIEVYFIGVPATLVYNFGSSILRAIGDTRRPLFYLLVSGVINVILNLIFVIYFSMGVAGVAAATVLSQCISAFLIVQCLRRSDGPYRLRLKKLRIVTGKLTYIMKIGIPAGIQGAIFSISNVLIQSSINSFGSVAMAGSTAAGNIEGFVYTSMNAVYQTAISFTSQNYGARKYKRMRRCLIYCMILVTVVGLVTGLGATIFGRQLLGIYSSDPEVIEYGMQRLVLLAAPYFLCGMMDTMAGGLRGMGCSILPLIESLTGACALRIVWIYTVFAVYHSLDVLFLSYSVSWILTALAHVITYAIVWKHYCKGEDLTDR